MPACATGAGPRPTLPATRETRPTAGRQLRPGVGASDPKPLLLVPALDTRLLQQLAVLLLRHPLAALLDDRAHQATTLLGTTADGHAITLTPRREGWAHARKLQGLRKRLSLAQSPSVPATAQRCYGPVQLRRYAADRDRPASGCRPRVAAGSRMPDEPNRKAGGTRAPGAAAVPVSPLSAASGSGQPVPTNAARRYWLTACSGTRKERPTRIASSSPECTSR